MENSSLGKINKSLFWECFKNQCCVDPETAFRCVVEEEDIKKAITEYEKITNRNIDEKI